MEEVFQKAISAGPFGALFLLVYVLYKPPAWAHSLITAKIASIDREGDLLAKLVQGQIDHLIADRDLHAQLRELIVKQAQVDRHDLKDAVHAFGIKLSTDAADHRDMICTRIDDAMESAIGRATLRAREPIIATGSG